MPTKQKDRGIAEAAGMDNANRQQAADAFHESGQGIDELAEQALAVTHPRARTSHAGDSPYTNRTYTDAGSTRLLIVHPDRLVRESLARVLAQHEEFTVLDTSDGHDSMALVAGMHARRADIVILDIALTRRYGPLVIAELKSSAPNTRVLVTGVPDRDADILAMIELGAAGYVTRDASLQTLISNIRALRFGQTLCSPRVASLLFSRVASRPQAPADMHEGTEVRRLTRRELQVVALIEAGLTNKEIARQLSLEVQTVKNHVHNILDKLHVHRRIDAARHARVQGLLSLVASTST